MGLIQIEGMEFYAYHGCFKEEQIVGNKFIIDLEIEANLDKSSKSDNLNDTLNYQVMYKLIKEEMKKKSHLLENIANRILNSIYNNFSGIEKATIKVSKINPPMGGKIEKVSVTLKR
ncbi:MAG: dihydroneopterin aldolase [Bacteroidales bacterium]|nr:dihydroneopterin aldolase [Bacteroidales bacterium]